MRKPILFLCRLWKMTMSNLNAHQVCGRHYGTSLKSNCTIFALSSGVGKCGVAVIRVSGPQCRFAVKELGGSLTRPREATLRKLIHPVSGEILDKALILWFPGPKSFTGEDCAEFHVHGGPAVITSVLEALACVPGLQYANAGEFTKQAFLNGKMDLTEVEGLGDLIHAETEIQRKQALRQMEGDLGKLYTSWRMKLIKCLASCEAFIDFSEEENIEDDVLDKVQQGVVELENEVSTHLSDKRCGERLRNGVHVAILGQPNAGKSSLLNIMTRRPAAIVSPIAGTTRDVVETALNFSGYPVIISDTAGLRKTDDEVEKEGVRRALERARLADLRILLFDSIGQKGDLSHFTSTSKFVEAFFNSLISDISSSLGNCDGRENWTPTDDIEIEREHDLFSMDNIIIVVNKMDLVEVEDSSYLECLKKFEALQLISCKTGEGIGDFLEHFSTKIKNLCGNPLEGAPSLTQSRHRVHLNACLHYLADYHHLQNVDVVLATERLRLAAREIGQITGVISAEDVLDVLFQDFCIGK